jgi:hypothetical protein
MVSYPPEDKEDDNTKMLTDTGALVLVDEWRS